LWTIKAPWPPRGVLCRPRGAAGGLAKLVSQRRIHLSTAMVWSSFPVLAKSALDKPA